MITELTKRTDVLSIGEDNESVKASISDSSLGFILKNLSTLYSDPYGSVVRELTSNCYDANVAAGKKEEAAIVGFKYEDDLEYVFFQDKGNGMNPEFMRNVYMSYGTSTKRESNDVLGTFGLGSKSPLSLTSEYFIDSVVDGIEYNYVIYFDKEDFPSFQLLNEKETEQENGTIVKIILIDYTAKTKFVDAFKRQLIYFDNVYFKDTPLDNDFKMYYLENGRMSNTVKYDALHICYDKVYYPIDFTRLGIEPIKLPIGLYFNIGELEVSPTRESIKYNDKEIKLIKRRILGLLYEVVNKGNIQNDKIVDDLRVYTDSKNAFNFVIGDEVINLKAVVKNIKKNFNKEIKLKNPQYKLFKKLEVKEIHKNNELLDFYNYIYNLVFKYENGKAVKYDNDKDWMFRKPSYYLTYPYGNKVHVSLNTSVRHNINRSIGVDFILLNRDLNSKISKQRKKLFYDKVKSNFNIDKSTVSIIKFAKLFYEDLVKQSILCTTDYDQIVPVKTKIVRNKIQSGSSTLILNDLSEYYKKDRKKSFIIHGEKKSILDENGKKTGKKKWIKKGLTSEKLHVIHDDEKSLEIYNAVNFKNVNFYSLNSKDYSAFKTRKLIDKSMNNVITLEEFTKHNAFKQLATSFILEKEEILKKIKESIKEEDRKSTSRYNYSLGKNIITPYLELSGNYTLAILLKYLNEDIYNDAIKLINHVDNYSISMYRNMNEELVPEFKENIIEIAKGLGYINLELVNSLENVKKFFEDIDLIFYTNITKENVPYLINYMKAMKKRLNDEHYNFLYKEYELELYIQNQEKLKYINSIKQKAA